MKKKNKNCELHNKLYSLLLYFVECWNSVQLYISQNEFRHLAISYNKLRIYGIHLISERVFIVETIFFVLLKQNFWFFVCFFFYSFSYDYIKCVCYSISRHKHPSQLTHTHSRTHDTKSRRISVKREERKKYNTMIIKDGKKAHI